MPRLVLILACIGMLVACSAGDGPHVTEFEYDRPAAPSPSEVLVVDWTQATATALSVGESVTLAFGDPRYGVAQIDSDSGSAEMTLSIPENIDPVVWLVSPSRRVVAFVRGRESARALTFRPKDHGRYFLVVRDAHFAEGQVTVSLRN